MNCPLPISFNDLAIVDFILGSFGCDGSMTDFGFLRNEMMKNDDCHNGFPPRLGRLPKIKNGVATDLFCTGVIGHPGSMFLH